VSEERQRVDVWLFRARLAKTRAAAARLVSEGGVRLTRDGSARQLDRPSVEVAKGDALSFRHGKQLRTVKVAGLGTRRGPATEARGLYEVIPETK
jgi:ribosome-associated heat shock protein Hsp15